MDASGSEIDLDASFRFEIFRIKRHLLLLLLSTSLHIERVAEIIVMQMKGRFVVPVPIGRDGLTVGDSRVLYQHVDIGAALAIHPADKPLHGKSMVRLMRGMENDGKEKQGVHTDDRHHHARSNG